VQGDGAIAPESPGRRLRMTLKTCEIRRAWAQKGSPAKSTGQTSCVAAQYIQKTPKNNGISATWLMDFQPIRGLIGGSGSIPSFSDERPNDQGSATQDQQHEGIVGASAREHRA
jgi:hypothetical protein